MSGVTIHSGNKYCVYTHSFDGRVVYVGKGRATRPFETHLRGSAWKKFFKGKAVEVTIAKWFSNEADAKKHESELIEELNPVLNKRAGKDGTRITQADRKRKDKVFSVSVTKDELQELTEIVKQLEKETGFRISRNQFVRKSALAVCSYMKMIQNDEEPDVMELFRAIN